MTLINKDLLARLTAKLNLSKPRVYALIDEKVRSTHLPRNLAAIALAAERGVGISKYASADELAAIRQGTTAGTPPSVVAPLPQSGATSSRRSSAGAKKKSAPRRRGNTVFVVHGRNSAARDAIFSFLRSVALKPLEWSQAIRLAGGGSPYVGDILEAAFREAAAVVVLLTPDDEARLSSGLLKKTDQNYERDLTGQARPNVLFEAGMAFGKNPNSTVLVEMGSLRPFSDVAGRHVVRLTNQAASRQEFVTKLANAGCNVDISGADWLSVGDFDAAIA